MSILGSFSNILNSIGSAVESAFQGTTVGNLGANISGLFPKTTSNNQQTFPLNAYGQTVVTQPLLSQPAAVKISNPATPAAQRIQTANDIQQNSSFNQGYIQAGQPLPGSTPTEVNQFINSGANNSYSSGYVAPTPKTNSGTPIAQYDTAGHLTGYSYTQGETQGSGTQNQTFGGQTGNIGGGASLLPSSLATNASTSAGGSALGIQYGTTQPTTQQPYLQFAGSPDIFDAKTGARITPEQAMQAGIFGPNGTLNNVQQVNTPRPGVTTSDQYAAFNNTNLSPTEASLVNKDLGLTIDSSHLQNAESGDVESQLKDLRTKITDMIAAGVTTEKQLLDQVAAQDQAIADDKAQLRSLDLFTTTEVKAIADNPDFSKQMQQRRQFWLTQSVQSPVWLARLTLNSEIQGATDNRQSLIDTFNLTKSMNDSQLSNYKTALDMLKPDSIAYKSDANGDMHATYYDPITNSIKDTIVASGYPKDQQFSSPDTIKANGNVYSVSRNLVTGAVSQVLIGKDPDFVTQPGSGSVVPIGGTVTSLQQANTIIGKLPAGQQTQAIATVSAIQNGNDILGLINGGSSDVTAGPFSGRAQTTLQKLGIAKDDFTKLQSLMVTYSANYIKGISGVAVSEQEYNRLAQALPTVNDTLTIAVNKINTVNSVMNNTFQAQTGRTYQPSVAKTTNTGSNNPTVDFKSLNLDSASSWSLF